MRVDVLVAGGGSAGIAAAVAAARAGAKTLLVERHSALGGMASQSLVHSICGLYRLRSGSGAEMAHTGFPVEFAQALLACGGAEGPLRFGRVDILLQRPVAFAWVADQIVRKEPNLSVRFHTELAAVESRPGQVSAVELLCRGVDERIEASTFVDTTGDATLSWLTGAGYEVAPTLQRPAFIFSLGGVKAGVLEDEGRLKVAQRFVAAVRNGKIPSGLLGAQLRPTAQSGEAFVTLDLDNPPECPLFDPLSPESLSSMESYGRELAVQLVDFLRVEVDGFQKSHIAAFPSRVGIRESRRVCGEYQITAEDILGGARFPDAVASSAWPIEMREQATGPRLRFPEENRVCEIPLRALCVQGFSNLYVAGRCISSTHEAQAALRVIGTCFATGEAAGIAAALNARGRNVTAAEVNAARVPSSKDVVSSVQAAPRPTH